MITIIVAAIIATTELLPKPPLFQLSLSQLLFLFIDFYFAFRFKSSLTFIFHIISIVFVYWLQQQGKYKANTLTFIRDIQQTQNKKQTNKKTRYFYSIMVRTPVSLISL